MREHGRPPTIAERKALTVLSREPKSVDHAPAFEQWQRRAEAAGGANLPAPSDGHAPADRWVALSEVIAELSDPASPYYLTREHASIDDRSFRAAVAEAAQGRLPGSDFDWLLRRVQAAPELRQIGGGHWTTRAQIEAEEEVVATVRRKAPTLPSPPAEVVAAAIENARVHLSAEQRVAVEQLSRSGFGLLTAPAGAGKGEVLRAVAQVRKATGHRVLAIAAAGETAQRFGREIDSDLSLTVEAFTRGVATRRLILTGRDAVFVDEAGLLEDTRWLGITRALGTASVTATGDAAQLAPIEAGGLWSKLTKELGTARLTENFRARDAWAKGAWTDLREGRALRGIARLERKRQIVISPTRQSSREAAVERWDADRREAAARGRGIENYLLLATTSNVDVDLLNAAAQQRRIDAGELGITSIEVRTQGEAGEERVEQMHSGDRVAFTRQVRFSGWRPRVENGATGTILSVDPIAQTVDVELADRVATLRGPQIGALRLGYAQHLYRSQGRTVDSTYIVTGGWQTGREAVYTAVSRSRDASHVYTDYSSLGMETHNRKAALRELAERTTESRAKVSALGWRDGERPHTPEDEQMRRQRGPTGQDKRKVGRFTQFRSEQREAEAREREEAARQARNQLQTAQRDTASDRARADRERELREDEQRRGRERDGGREWW